LRTAATQPHSLPLRLKEQVRLPLTVEGDPTALRGVDGGALTRHACRTAALSRAAGIGCMSPGLPAP